MACCVFVAFVIAQLIALARRFSFRTVDSLKPPSRSGSGLVG